MGIYIKNMDMPSRCSNCFLNRECGSVADNRKAGTGQCPLVEVPTPHGRLVDLDALLEEQDKKYHEAREDGWGLGKYLSSYCEEIDEIKEAIEDAPVIIEAEGEK